MKSALEWFKKHPVLSGIFVLVFVLGMIPLFVQILMVIPSIFPQTVNNSWIGFWGAYVGAITGAVVTLIGIRMTINSNRKIMLEDYRIRLLPYFHIDENVHNVKNRKKVCLEYKLTEVNEKSENVKEYSIEFQIKNISSVYALNPIIAAVNSHYTKYTYRELLLTNHKKLDIIEPDESVLVHLNIMYDPEKISDEKDIVFLGKNIFVWLCFNTVHDNLVEKEVTAKNYARYFGRTNKFVIYVGMMFEADIEVPELRYHSLSTRKIEW